MIVGVDGGNSSVKVVSEIGLDRFSSAIGEYRERKMENSHGDSDIVFEYQGRKGFAGTLAEMESEFVGSIMGESKAHDDAKLRILIALHRIKTSEFFQIIVGQPISRHEPTEKEYIKNMLLGSHDLTINNKRKIIKIDRVEVAAEGGAAFWSAPCEGLVRIIDIGSATVNCASLLDGKYIDQSSFTIPFGFETVKSKNIKEMARGICTRTSEKWGKEDMVFVVGGIAEKFLPAIAEFYPHAADLKPTLNQKQYSSIFANAIGFYKIGKSIYGS